MHAKTTCCNKPFTIFFQLFLLKGFETPSDLKTYLESGKRLAPPQYCPSAISDVMYRCWNLTPTERPSFDVLSEELYEVSAVFYICLHFLIVINSSPLSLSLFSESLRRLPQTLRRHRQ